MIKFRDDTPIEELAVSGIGWSLSRVLVESTARLAIGVVLARLLSPVAFGLMAIIILINGAVSILFSAGIWASVIQSRNLEEDHVRVALTISLVLGVLAFLLVWFTAPLAVSFFQDQEARALLRVAAIELVFLGFEGVVRSLGIRRLDLKSVLYSETIGTAFGYGLIGITLACAGAGAWSLVLGYLSRTLLSCLCLILMERPPLRPLFRFHIARALLGFGSGVTATSALNFAAIKVDTIFVGHYLSSSELGLYSKAFAVMQLPTSLFSKIVSGVLFAYMAEVQDERQRLEKAYLAALSSAALICFPVLLGMAAASDYVIIGLYGGQWAGAVDIFRIIMVAGILKPMISVVGAVIRAVGLVHREAIRQAIYLAILTAGAFVGVRFGTSGVATAVVFGAFWSYWSVSRIVNKRLCIGWGRVLKTLAPGLIVGATVAGASWFSGVIIEGLLAEAAVPIKLLLVVAGSALAYVAAVFSLPISLRGDAIPLIARLLEPRTPAALKGVLRKLAE